jgi:hypothetical protein
MDFRELAAGTHLQGYVHINFGAVAHRLGQPNPEVCDHLNHGLAAYVFPTKDADGNAYAITLYATLKPGFSRYYSVCWHVGGKQKSDVAFVEKLLRPAKREVA